MVMYKIDRRGGSKNRILGPRPEWENSQVKVNYREITIINNQF